VAFINALIAPDSPPSLINPFMARKKEAVLFPLGEREAKFYVSPFASIIPGSIGAPRLIL
jgi:hypothetical protein